MRKTKIRRMVAMTARHFHRYAGLIALLGITVLLASCGGGGGGNPLPPPGGKTIQTETVQGQLQIPQGVQLNPAQIEAFSFIGTSALDSSGRFSITVPYAQELGGDNYDVVLFLDSQTRNLVAVGQIFPTYSPSVATTGSLGKPQYVSLYHYVMNKGGGTSVSGDLAPQSVSGQVTVDLQTTALGIIFLNPIFSDINGEMRRSLTSIIVKGSQKEKFATLVGNVFLAQKEAPLTGLDPQQHADIYQLAAEIGGNALTEYTGSVAPQSLYPQAPGPQCKDLPGNPPTVQDGPGASLVFQNCKMVTYAADITGYSQPFIARGKPRYQRAPFETTADSVSYGNYNVHLTMGFEPGVPPSDLINTNKAVGLASVTNTATGIISIVSLVTAAGSFYYNADRSTSLINSAAFRDLIGRVQEGRSVGWQEMVRAVATYISNYVTEVVNWLKDEYIIDPAKAAILRTYLGRTGEIISKVMSIINLQDHFFFWYDFGTARLSIDWAVSNQYGSFSATEGTLPSDPCGAIDTPSTAATLSLGSTRSCLIETSGDSDYFRLNLSSGGTLRIILTVPSGKDYDLYLYDSSQNQIENSRNGAGSPEEISRAITSGTYYVKVSGYGTHYSLSQMYYLTATLTTNQCPNPPSNPSPPNSAVSVSTNTTLTWSASDPDGDSLTYQVYLDPTNNPPTNRMASNWPNSSYAANGLSAGTTYFWQVKASDGKCSPVAGPVWSFTTRANQSPQITAGPSANPATVIEGNSTNLSVSANDPDGDPLTYLWSQPSGSGSFSDVTSRTPTWTAGDVSTTTVRTLRVTVSDGKGGSATGTVNVTVQPINDAPVINSGYPTATPSTVAEGGTITLSVQASDPNGDTLSYSWTQVSPSSPTGIFSNSSAATTQWTAPSVNANASFTLRATASDGRASTSAQVSVTVTDTTDTTPPTNVQVTAPTSGQSVSGTITFKGTAQDNSGTIQKMEFYLDSDTTPACPPDATPKSSGSTFQCTWDSTTNPNGSHTVKAKAYDPSNNFAISSSVSFTVNNAPTTVDEGFESGNLTALPWQTGGNQPWSVVSSERNSGSYSAKPGAISHNQTSYLEVTLNITQADNITFYRKVSSEACCDALRFKIDGNTQSGAEWKGEVPWGQVSYPVTTGTHTFRWEYTKDGSVSSGSDAGWIDDIDFPPYTEVQTYKLTVNKAGDGGGTVTSNPPGINCGADCNENYYLDTVVVLTALPGSGSTFMGWGGACSGTSTTTQVTMNANKTCTANFATTGDTCPSVVVSDSFELYPVGTYPSSPWENFASGQSGLVSANGVVNSHGFTLIATPGYGRIDGVYVPSAQRICIVADVRVGVASTNSYGSQITISDPYTLAGGGGPSLEVYFGNNQNIYAYAPPATPVLLGSWAENTYYTVRIEADIFQKKFSVWINGELKASDISFTDKGTSAVTLGANWGWTMHYDNVRVSYSP